MDNNLNANNPLRQFCIYIRTHPGLLLSDSSAGSEFCYFDVFLYVCCVYTLNVYIYIILRIYRVNIHCKVSSLLQLFRKKTIPAGFLPMRRERDPAPFRYVSAGTLDSTYFDFMKGCLLSCTAAQTKRPAVIVLGTGSSVFTFPWSHSK